VAGVAPKLTEGGNIGANNATSGQQRFDDRKAEAFDGGRRDDGFAVAIAPLELGFGEALTEKDGIFETGSANRMEDAPGFRTGNADDDQARRRVETFGAQEMLEDFDEEWDVLIAAMLPDAQKKGLAAPAGQRSLWSANRSWLDAVIDASRYLTNFKRSVVVKVEQCGFRDAGDGIDRTKALAEKQAIEETLQQTEIRRDLVGVEIVERDNNRARKGLSIERCGVPDVHHICSQITGEHGKIAIEPENAAE
jgi:hypothetical protein